MTSTTPFAKFNIYEGLLVHVELGSKSPTMEDFREFLTGISQLLDNGQPFTLFVDASQLGTVPMATSLETVKFLREERPRIRNLMKASAIFITSNFVINLLNWVFTLQAPASPNIVVNNAVEGMRFIESYMTPVHIEGINNA